MAELVGLVRASVDRMAHEDGLVAEKYVSANEPYFQGHFPGKPIMPGVMMIEAVAQAARLEVSENRRQSRKELSMNSRSRLLAFCANIKIASDRH